MQPRAYEKHSFSVLYSLLIHHIIHVILKLTLIEDQKEILLESHKDQCPCLGSESSFI